MAKNYSCKFLFLYKLSCLFIHSSKFNMYDRASAGADLGSLLLGATHKLILGSIDV